MSKRQKKKLGSDAVEVDFAALSTASSLDCLLDHSDQLSQKLKDVTEVCLRLSSDSRRQGNEQELVSSFANTTVQLASAVRRACELLGHLAVLKRGTAPAEALAQDDEVPGCAEACVLLALLGQQLLLFDKWLSVSGEPQLQADRMKLKIAQDVASSGLLLPLARLCDMVSANITQQQGQQQQLHSDVKMIVSRLMVLTAALLVFWPGKWFSGRTLAPVLPSLLSLLVSALCSSRSRSWLDRGRVPYWVRTVLPRMIVQIHKELEPVADAVTEQNLDRFDSLPSETVDILQSHAVQHLPLLAAASLMEQLLEHKKGAGETGASSSTQQQQRQQLVAAHEELYRAVGVCDCFVLEHYIHPDSPLVPNLLIWLIDVSATVLTCQEAIQAHSRINNSSLNSSNGSTQQQQGMLVQPKVCYALLSVAVEVLGLNPANCTTAAAMLTCIESLLELLEFQLSVATTESAAPRLSGNVPAACHDAAEVMGYMQRSSELVLLQVVPAVMLSLTTTSGAAVGAGSNEGASSSNCGSRENACRLLLAQLLQRVVSDGGTPTTSSDATAVLTAYQQNPVTTLTSLEAGLRLLATEAAMDASATQEADDQETYDHDDLLSYLATLVVNLKAMTSQQTAINARPEQQQQQKLISLGISMLKCSKRLWSCDRAWQLIGLVALVLETSLLVARAAAGSSNGAGINDPPTSITTVEAGMQTHLLVFIGRCLFVMADFVHIQLSSNSVQLPVLIMPNLWSAIKTMLPHATAAVQLLQQQSAAFFSIGSTSATAVMATAARTLQQQAVSLQDSLTAAKGPWQELLQQPLPQTEEVPGSPGTFELIPDGHTSANLALALLKLGFGASGEGAQQLSDFAAAVCAAVPVPCCCNNPDCDNLSRFSDNELVSGKSCVCARCEVARYCGRECQVAHWPQHKAACKRIKASKNV